MMLENHYPVPRRGSELDQKFTYFYKPYNYLVNTHKFMRFETEPEPEVFEEPGNTAKSEVAAEPEVLGKPEVPGESEVAAEPGDTAEPETLGELECTAEQEGTKKSETEEATESEADRGCVEQERPQGQGKEDGRQPTKWFGGHWSRCRRRRVEEDLGSWRPRPGAVRLQWRRQWENWSCRQTEGSLEANEAGQRA